MVMGKNCVADRVLLKLYSFINWDVIFSVFIWQFSNLKYIPMFLHFQMEQLGMQLLLLHTNSLQTVSLGHF